MSAIKAATVDGALVLRVIRPNGEDAWRHNPDGTWDHCADHKGPWVRSNAILVPAPVLRFAAACQRSGSNLQEGGT